MLTNTEKRDDIKISFDDGYPDGFFHWLHKNSHIYYEFERRALRMARLRLRYSARTIVEVIRWETDLEDSQVGFKINDHYTPGMARLWMATHGEKHQKFFEIRS